MIVVIPIHNQEANIQRVLDGYMKQSVLPKHIVDKIRNAPDATLKRWLESEKKFLKKTDDADEKRDIQETIDLYEKELAYRRSN
jgi:hypothetical protein